MRVRVLFMVLSIFAFVLTGCKEKPGTKEFLFENSNIKFQIEEEDKMYDLYTPKKTLDSLRCTNKVITFHIGQKEYDVLLTGDEQRIGKTNYFVKANVGL